MWTSYNARYGIYEPTEIHRSAGYDGTNGKMVACGKEFSLVLLTSGKVIGFGRNYYGNLGRTLNNDSNTGIEAPIALHYNVTVPNDIQSYNLFDSDNTTITSSTANNNRTYSRTVYSSILSDNGFGSGTAKFRASSNHGSWGGVYYAFDGNPSGSYSWHSSYTGSHYIIVELPVGVKLHKIRLLPRTGYESTRKGGAYLPSANKSNCK